MYILSAVRTPICLLNGSLSQFSIGQLSAIILKEALERAIVPAENVEHLFIACALDSNFDNEIIKRTALKKSTNVLTSKCSLQSFVNACQFLLQNDKKISLAGGAESMSNNLLYNEHHTLGKNRSQEKSIKQLLSFIGLSNQNDCGNYITADKTDEVAKIIFRKKGHQIRVTDDEYINGGDKSQKIQISTAYIHPGDGAAAAVIANEDYVKKNHLTPLARVESFACESIGAAECALSISQAIGKALNVASLHGQNISVCEINTTSPSIVSSCINQSSINPSAVNKCTAILGCGYPIGMYGGKMISHVVHSLSPGEFGCAAAYSIDGSASAVVLQKLCTNTSAKPQLTLYTKKACPLCDELEMQISPHKDRFSIQKIDIEIDGNEKLNNLFRYEIPVLFLDGTFLCKHTLDSEHFIRRLCKSEEARLNVNKKVYM